MPTAAPAHSRPTGRLLVALAVALAALSTIVLRPDAASGAELQATPESLTGVFSAAQAGDTISLAPGDYGIFRGGMKPGVVTLRPQAGAAVTMELNFDPASNITIEGVVLREIEIANAQTKNITVRGNDIPGQTTLRTGELQDAGILFDGNVHRDFDKCAGCGEGRIHLPENTARPSGVTIANSRFLRGNSDGIQNGSNGTRILNNEFADILQVDGADGVHADAIQLYGSKNTLIKGNWMHNVSSGIMAPDGADHEVIEDNVIQATNPYTIQLGSDNGSIIRHNTLPDGACEFDARCGVLTLGSKPGEPAGRGTVITDNVLGQIAYTDGSATVAQENHNLLASAAGRGADDRRGKPTYVGGASPKSYDGFALAAGSAGKGTASDGLDRGARITPGEGRPSGTPSAATAPPARSAASAAKEVGDRSHRLALRILSRRSSLGRTSRLRLAVRSSTARTVVLRAAVRPGAADGRPTGHSHRLIRLRPKVLDFRRAGRRVVTFDLGRSAVRALARTAGARLVVRAYADRRQTRLLGIHTLRVGR